MRKTDAAILLLGYFGTGLTYPVLSLVLINKGCSMAQLALVIGAFSLTGLLMELPSGIFADRYGRKRTFLLSKMLAAAATLVLLLFHGLAAVLCALTLYGGGKAFGSGSMDALLIDRCMAEDGPEALSKVTAQLSLLETVGVAVGSVGGGALPALLQHFAPQRLYDGNLLLSLLCNLCVALLALRFVREMPRSKDEERVLLRAYLREGTAFVRSSPVVLLLTAGGFVTGFFLSTVETYWQPAFTALLPDRSMLWLLGMLSFGCMGLAALGTVVMRRALHTGRISNVAGYCVMRLAMGGFLLLLAFAPGPARFGAWYFLLYFTFGAANLAESVLLNREIPAAQRAGMLSFFSLVIQLGALLAAGVAGAVVSFRGIGMLWAWEGAAVVLTAAVIGILLKRAEEASREADGAAEQRDAL